MQKKSETFSKFCEFKALVEKDSRKQVKALRSDHGGEYIVEPQRCSFLSPNFTSFPLSLINYRIKLSIVLIKVTLGMYTMTNLIYFLGFVVVVIFD